MFEESETTTITPIEPEYPMLYAALAAYVAEARAHLAHDAWLECQSALDRAHAIIVAQGASKFIAS